MFSKVYDFLLEERLQNPNQSRLVLQAQVMGISGELSKFLEIYLSILWVFMESFITIFKTTYQVVFKGSF